MTAAHTPIHELLSHRRKMLLLVTLMACTFAQSLDQAIVVTASPSVVSELGGFSLLPWVFTSYLLGSVTIVPVVGRLSDTLGRKPFLLAGLLLFVAGAMVSGTSLSMPQLILARGVQGIGSGAVISSVFAVLADLFTPIERGKYIGIFVTGFSMGAILGPPLGGVITDTIGWRWVFFVNVPFALAAAALVWRNLPGLPRGSAREPFDSWGAACLAGATAALVLGLVWGGRELGWTAPGTLGLLGLAVALGAVFVVQDLRHPGALFPADMFRRRELGLVVAGGALLSAGTFGAITYLPAFVQTALGGSATTSGLVTTPQAAGILAASLVGGRLVARTGRYRMQAFAGAGLVTVSVGLLTQVGVGTAEWRIAAVMVVLGLGVGFANPMLSMVAQFVVRREHVGSATAVRFYSQSMGSLMGTAVLGIVLASSYEASFEQRVNAGGLALPATVAAEFEDPTLRLREADFDEAAAIVRAQPGGDETLAGVLDAQEAAVAAATRRIFVVAFCVSAAAALLIAGMRDIPLRGSAAAEPSTEPGAAAGETPALAEGETRA